MNLSTDEHGVDQPSAVVYRRVAEHRDDPGVPVHLDDRDVRARWDHEALGGESGRRLHPDPGGLRHPGEFRQGDRPPGSAPHGGRPAREDDVSRCGFEEEQHQERFGCAGFLVLDDAEKPRDRAAVSLARPRDEILLRD